MPPQRGPTVFVVCEIAVQVQVQVVVLLLVFSVSLAERQEMRPVADIRRQLGDRPDASAREIADVVDLEFRVPRRIVATERSEGDGDGLHGVSPAPPAHVE